MNESSKKYFDGDLVEKAGIPDDDMPAWIQTLREGGFTDEEMDRILGNLNDTYAKLKGIDFVEEELKRIEEEYAKKNKRYFNNEEREYFRKGIKERLGK